MTIADSGFMMENGGSCLPYTPEQEKQIVDDLMNKSESSLKEGNLYYVVSNRQSHLPFFGSVVLLEFTLHAAFLYRLWKNLSI